jgi:hypothetical protein
MRDTWPWEPVYVSPSEQIAVLVGPVDKTLLSVEMDAREIVFVRGDSEGLRDAEDMLGRLIGDLNEALAAIRDRRKGVGAS